MYLFVNSKSNFDESQIYCYDNSIRPNIPIYYHKFLSFLFKQL